MTLLIVGVHQVVRQPFVRLLLSFRPVKVVQRLLRLLDRTKRTFNLSRREMAVVLVGGAQFQSRDQIAITLWLGFWEFAWFAVVSAMHCVRFVESMQCTVHSVRRHTV